MGFFEGVLGPSREEVWKELCARIGADFVEGGFWKGDKVQAHFKNWTITLDTYTVSTGHVHETFTRIRAPFVSHEELRFRIYPRRRSATWARCWECRTSRSGTRPSSTTTSSSRATTSTRSGPCSRTRR